MDGALTDAAIPSPARPATPSRRSASTESGVLIGQRPTTHDDRLWVFDHKSSASALDPAGTACGACHTRTYCESCHKTAAVKVKHDDMMSTTTRR